MQCGLPCVPVPFAGIFLENTKYVIKIVDKPAIRLYNMIEMKPLSSYYPEIGFICLYRKFW